MPQTDYVEHVRIRGGHHDDETIPVTRPDQPALVLTVPGRTPAIYFRTTSFDADERTIYIPPEAFTAAGFQLEPEAAAFWRLWRR